MPDTDNDVTLLEREYDEIAVEPSEGPDNDQWLDVWVQPGHYWATVLFDDVKTLQDRGHVTVWDRRTRDLWKAA